MVLKVFAVRDVKAKAFMQPFFSTNADVALRAFADGVREDTKGIGKHPEDYILYELGLYDDSTGALEKLDSVHMLGIGTDFVVKGIDMIKDREVVVNGKT